MPANRTCSPVRAKTPSPSGPSDLGTFVVGQWPEVADEEPNNTRSQAQAVPFPVTLVVKPEQELVLAVAGGEVLAAQLSDGRQRLAWSLHKVLVAQEAIVGIT